MATDEGLPAPRPRHSILSGTLVAMCAALAQQGAVTDLPAAGTVVVVGASLAGLRACEELRRHGFSGRVVLVGEERHLPYDRPPLSKQYLAGTWGFDRVELRSPEHVDGLGLDLRLGVRAVGLDLAGRRVDLGDGTAVAFDGLVVATGASPRRLQGPRGVVTLRTLEDADDLRQAISVPGCRLVVVGGGFLGLEVASTARAAGLSVVVVEPLPTPLGRVVGPAIGRAVQDLHEEHGVEVLTGAGVTGFLGSSDVEGVLLDDARVVPADLVLVAIGADPETSWLDGAGLTIDRGVVCDATLSAAPGVVAAGDLVRFPHPLAESSVRLEHWTNAAEQGAHAVRTLLADPGAAEAFSPVPYFWSDQFDVRIQAIGLPDPGDEVIVVDGSLESRRFVSVHGREGRLVAALAFGRPRQLMSLRPLIARGARLEEATALLR